MGTEGIVKLYNRLRKTNHNAVTMKICEHARHNLLAEKCKYDIMYEILDWLNIYSYDVSEQG